LYSYQLGVFTAISQACSSASEDAARITNLKAWLLGCLKPPNRLYTSGTTEVQKDF
jgi:hypothetical protein